MLRTRENSDVFNSLDEIYLVFTSKKQISSIYSLIIYLFQVRNEFYKDTQGALLVYDVGDRNSFESLDSWLLEMQNEIGNQTETDNVVICVCANKVGKIIFHAHFR